MPQQVIISRIEKRGRIFILHFADASSMEWADRAILDDFIDNGKAADDLVRGLWRRIRNADPTLANIGTIINVTYELPEVREVP